MHWVVRRIPRKISSSANHRGEFNVSFSKERGTLGCFDPRTFILDEKDTFRSSRNISQNATKRSALLSRTFARDFSTSARKKPPEPQGVPLLGTMLSLMMAGGAQKLHEYVDRRHRELGPIFRDKIGPLRAVFVKSPDEFRRIFLRLEGPTPQHFLPEAWRLYNEIRAERRGLLFMYAHIIFFYAHVYIFLYWHCVVFAFWNRDGDEWLYFRRILNKTMLLPDSAKLMCTPCQEAAENLARKWTDHSLTSSTIPNLESQLYLWSIESKPLLKWIHYSYPVLVSLMINDIILDCILSISAYITTDWSRMFLQRCWRL